jgi:hypothetical protein
MFLFMNEEAPGILIQRVYCKRVKTIITIIIIIITHAQDTRLVRYTSLITL